MIHTAFLNACLCKKKIQLCKSDDNVNSLMKTWQRVLDGVTCMIMNADMFACTLLTGNFCYSRAKITKK